MSFRYWQAFGALAGLSIGAACERAALPTQARPAPRSRAVAQSGAAATNTPVTSYIADGDQSIAPSLQIRSDGAGSYQNSRTLTSDFTSGGKWVLDAYFPKNSTRTIYLDFSRSIPGSGPDGGLAVAIPTGTYKFQAYVDCPSPYYNNNFLTIAPGQTVHCPLHVGELYVGSDLYSINMNPSPGSEGFTWSETNYANVTCTSTASPCKSWTITPSGTAPDGSAANVTVLLKHVVTSKNGATTPVKQGDFYMSFRIDVTNP